MMPLDFIVKLFTAARRRGSSESGFAMVVALGVLTVTSLLVAAIYVGVQAEVQATSRSSDKQQAYYAARAGEQAFLYQLNENPNYWTTCSNDYAPTPVAVPGSTSGTQYSYVPVYNPGYSNTNCTASTAIAALVDPNSGTLRMEFTGYAGPTNSSGVPTISETVVASFRKPSPLDFLWYTDHEMEDPALNSACTGEKYYYQYTNGAQPPASCEINWASGDTMDGPSYTNDQYLIYQGANPTFGRSGTDDQTESSAPEKSVCVNSNCQNASFQGGTPPTVAGAENIPLPQSVSSTQLLTDAQNNGNYVYTGTTTIGLTANANGTESATISNCPGSTSTATCSSVNTVVNNVPSIIYVESGSGCPSTYTASTYSLNNSGQYYGPCGDVYVHGTYNQPLTIVSDHDIIIVGNTTTATCYTPQSACTANPGLTTSTDSNGNPTGSATLGLVAGDFVRVMHPANVVPSGITIDAAILTLSHSFMVDNYSTGASNPQPYLTVHGAIAQRYRGIVGLVGSAGYLKNYHYDDRLKVILPPFLFSISTAGWEVSRETLCMPDTPATDSSSCAYTGP